MAADQRKKRVNAASLVGCTSREQYRVNSKRLQVQQHGLNMRPNISLEWDNKRKSVVSKREQIGIRRRHLIPCIEPGPHAHNILADVFSVPEEIFELENLSKVLSYEVWQNHLSGSERSFLSQFLPKEPEADTIVRDLLAGDNFHFGNPFVKWGASLCFGELHPDYVLHEEQSLRASKKAYYLDLQKYHNDMIESLQTWKERWASCQDAEVDIMHNMWRLKLATKDIPAGFANGRKSQLQRKELALALGEEIGKKLEHQEAALHEEKEGSPNRQTELSDDSEEEIPPSSTFEGVERELSDDSLEEQRDHDEAIHEMTTGIEFEADFTSSGLLYGHQNDKDTKSDYAFEERMHDDTEMIEAEDAPRHVFIRDHNQKQIASVDNSPRNTMITPSSPGFLQHQQQISSFNSNPHTNSAEMECDNAGSKTDEDPPTVSEYPGNMNHVDIPVSQGDSLPSASDVWPAGDVHGSYYQSTAINAGYASAQELSIGHPQFIQDQTVRILDMQTQRQDKDAGKNMLHRQPDDISFFSSYSNQDRSELLQSLFKGQGNLSYHNQQKQSGIEFQPAHDLMMEAGQFPGHFREQVHPPLSLDVRQKRINDLYMHQNIQESIYSGSRFAMPRQDHLPVNIHDWATVNTVRMPVPPQSQSHLNSGELSQSWYTGENGTRDGWPSFEVAVGVNHSLSSGSNSDQTLFSVLSECSELRPRASYDSMGSTERMVEAGNYSGIGGGIPSSSNFLQQSPNPLNYLSGHEAAAGIKINNLGWTGMPQQNSGIQESMGKPFLRSWNQ
ncbi:UNVERIFIED_CONTAM: hypothetical protein Sangu_1307000 [Sesamum angustifolium]|uniref:DEUBAD domain-containing protein n=1 Tax=Sesamum angustifolium TaxID=2727405 RepID=A0AAW2NNZ5_9LAMI